MPIPRKLTQNFVETEVDDEVLLVDLDGGELFSLEGTGRAIWRLIDGARDRESIVDELSAHYSISRDELTDDVTAFLGELADAALIEMNGR